MDRIIRAGLAGLLASLALAAPAAAADPTVSVRVEGDTSTLVPEVRVTPNAAVVVDKRPEGTTCDGAKGGGALELATQGDWGGRAFSFGGPPSQAVEVIKGQSHVFGSGAYWSFFVNNSPASEGICDYQPVEGDELLFAAACDGNAGGPCFDGDPLDVRGPRTAAPGTAFTVTVDEYTSPFGAPPTAAPSSGARVTGPGVDATTGATGQAQVTLAQRGPQTLTATKGGRIRDELVVCVTDGADGFCGTTKPQPGPQDPQPTPTPTATPEPCETTGDDGRCGTDDERAPEASIEGISEKQRFSRKGAPRRIRARVESDPSGLKFVKVSLARTFKGRCQVLSGSKDRFRKDECYTHPYFVVGDRPEVDYLLPGRLKPGRYVLDVVAIDKAGNRDELARGRNRVVFHVKKR